MDSANAASGTAEQTDDRRSTADAGCDGQLIGGSETES